MMGYWDDKTMDQDQTRYIQLVTAIFNTEQSEIQCAIAADMMSQSTEERLSTADSQQRFPALWQHFHMCPDCYDEYQMLVELIRLEDAEQLVEPTAVPPVPTEKKPAWRMQIADAFTTAFAGFPKAAAAPSIRGETLGVEPVQLSLDNEQFRLEFDVEISEQNSQHRDLFCAVESLVENGSSQFEAAPVWLQVGDEGPILYEEALDELGEAVFTNLPPDRYTFGLQIGQQLYIVQDLFIP